MTNAHLLAVGPSLQVRRLVYICALAAGLIALFASAALTALGNGPPGGHPLLLLVPVVAAVLGLLWLRPRMWLYGAGVLCLALALLILWVWRPDGPLLGESIPVAAQIAGVVMYVLFPASWMLFAKAVASWRAGAVAYLLTGFVFVLEFVAAWTISLGTSGLSLSWLWALFMVNWPFYALVMAGIFGHRFA